MIATCLASAAFLSADSACNFDSATTSSFDARLLPAHGSAKARAHGGRGVGGMLVASLGYFVEQQS